MKPQISKHLRARLLLITPMLLALPFESAMAFTRGCWVDLYEYSNYVGKVARIEGPASLASMKKIDGKNWDSRVDSLVVGPNAKVMLYEHPGFKMTLGEMANYPELMKSLGISEDDVRGESELVFGANEKVHHLGEFNFHKKARSIKVECT